MSKITKLGLGIVAFDDTCHLKNIVSEVRDLCDEITICLQQESYHGDPIDQSVVEYVEGLKREGLVDSVIWFTATKKYDCEEDFVGIEPPIVIDPKNPNKEEEERKLLEKRREDRKNAGPRLIETDKRNFILDYLEKECGCSHCHIIDSDEFYDHEDYEKAKKVINDVDSIHVTYCEYINYYRDYCHLMVWPFRAYVPFITESKYRYSFYNGSFDKPSDPTRRFLIEEEHAQYCILSFQCVKMHHLSWIRKNINEKISNWSSKKYFDNMPGLFDKIIDRYNNYRDGQNAIIMFNTPNNEVVVTKLKCAYINPKYSLFDV
jgi:hypothetical protein